MDPETSTTFEEFLLALGAAQLAAGYPVNDVDTTLKTVCHAYRRTDVNILVLPAALMLDDPVAGRARVIGDLGPSLRLDQAAIVHDVAADARRGQVDPADGIARIAAIYDIKPRFPPWATVAGYGLAAAGFALVFRLSLWGIAMAFVCGIFVGVLMRASARRPNVAPLVPPIAAMICAFAVFGFGTLIDADVQPLRVVAAPLITLIPGAALTRGTQELASGHTISGTSRLVSSIVQILVLTFGILIGAQLAQVSPWDLSDLTAERLPLWAAWLGVAVYAIGQAIASSEPRGAMRIMVPLLLIAYTIQTIVAWRMDAVLGAGLAAAVTLFLALVIQKRTRRGTPAFVLFQPVFWLLVPGSLGLIAVTEALTGNTDTTANPGGSTSMVESLATGSGGGIILLAGASIIAITIGMQVAAIAGRLVPERSAD